MTDTQQSAPAASPNNSVLEQSTAQSQLVQKLSKELTDGGMSPDSVGFIMGRIVSRIARQVLDDAATVVGPQTLDSLSTLPDDLARLQALDKAFTEKKGMTLFQYRDHLAEQMMTEYDSLT